MMKLKFLQNWKKEYNSAIVFGTGYWGIITMYLLKDAGIHVIGCMDNNSEKYNTLYLKDIECQEPRFMGDYPIVITVKNEFFAKQIWQQCKKLGYRKIVEVDFDELKRSFVSMSDKKYIEMIYAARFNGYMIDWNNLKTFNEKIQYLKLYDRKPEYTRMVDKYEVKKYVSEKIGSQYTIPTLGVWEHFDEINFDELPNQFVLKCTHDSESVIVVTDKNKLDLEEVKNRLEKSLSVNYYELGREWAYKDVQPRIIAETYMKDGNAKGLTDYKFYCFHGEPCFLYISEGLEDHATARISFVTMEWELAQYERSDFAPFEKLPDKPKTFEEMIYISRVLAKNIPFVRIDLYQINGKVYFSEMTLYPASGWLPLKKIEHDVQIGEMLKIDLDSV